MSSHRSSALSRASSLKGRGSASDLVNRLEANIVPVLMIAAVVAAFAIAWLVADQYKGAKVAGWFDVVQKATVAGVLLLASLAAVAWVTAHAYMHADSSSRLMLLALFGGVVVVFAISLYFHFCRTDSHNIAFYLMLLVLLAALVHSWLVWRAGGFMGVAGMIPLALVVVYLVVKFYPGADSTTVV